MFVHGLTGSWPNWLEQLPVFAAKHRVVAIDLPGFAPLPDAAASGSRSPPTRACSTGCSTSLIDATTIVGNSMGGFVSADLAIAFPQRVERLVLVSPAGLSTYRERRGTRVLGVLRRFERVLATCTAWGAANADAITGRPGLRMAILSDLVSHPGRLGAPLAAELVRGAGKPGFMQALAANLDYDFRDRLPEIVCPALIVWGERDHVVTVRDAAVYAELIPGSRKVVFQDTGHLAMVERPDAFNALLTEFLSE